MGTGAFLLGMTLFVTIWLTWNSLAPVELQFDPRALNFTLLTLILSLQASYAAPLILLAQNRQDDRDRVKFEQDRQRAERNLNDTEYLAREVAALRLALEEVATKDFVQDEMQQLLKQIDSRLEAGNDKKGNRGTKSGN
jgi:Predicted membrane protein